MNIHLYKDKLSYEHSEIGQVKVQYVTIAHLSDSYSKQIRRSI